MDYDQVYTRTDDQGWQNVLKISGIIPKAHVLQKNSTSFSEESSKLAE